VALFDAEGGANFSGADQRAVIVEETDSPASPMSWTEWVRGGPAATKSLPSAVLACGAVAGWGLRQDRGGSRPGSGASR